MLQVDLDGRYRTTPAGPRGCAAAVRGQWRASSGLDLHDVEPYGANAFSVRAEFEDDRVRLTVRDQTCLYGEHVMQGRLRER